ncbi:glycosyltransferase [Sphingobacterium sp. JB170]|uniref:glycosyltransferase n=1 Tax=Sphingobacterium sp. JB170 TaxID=1434842 RepID=UPI00097F21B5|nr:glycosyltransferase [Sphingobacterium sp. JB170]SJN49819.1 hypothetical protein FM107_19275 [Sphingobacterium sp. JB170]
MINNIKLTLCTTIMDRLDFLKMTLPQNIIDNIDCINQLEFLILDYSSGDGLKEWLYSNYDDMLSNRSMSYYRIEGKASYNHSHSKNQAFKLAKGELVCNIDADNFTGPRFAEYLIDQFDTNANIFLSTTSRTFYSPNTKDWITGNSDFLGKIAVRKCDFFRVRGYDEGFTGYSFEDADLINRLEMLGLRRIVIDGHQFRNAIPHEDSLRKTDQIKSDVYIKQKTFYETYYLILRGDNSLASATMFSTATLDATNKSRLTTPIEAQFEYDVRDESVCTGFWQEIDDITLFVNKPSSLNQTYLKTPFGLASPNLLRPTEFLHHIKNEKLAKEIIMFHEAITNRRKMMQNYHFSTIQVNTKDWLSDIAIH